MGKSSWQTSWIGQMHGTPPPLLHRMFPVRKSFGRESAGEAVSCQTYILASRQTCSNGSNSWCLDGIADQTECLVHFSLICHVVHVQAYTDCCFLSALLPASDTFLHER